MISASPLYNLKSRLEPMLLKVRPVSDTVDHGEQAGRMDRGQDAVPCAAP